MHASRAFSAALLCAAWLLVGANSVAPGPREVVQSTMDEVIAILKDPSVPIEVRRDRIVEVAYQRFDFTTMSKLVLAKYWKAFSPAQREDFLKEFKNFLAHRYGDRIDRYDQEKVEITGERSAVGGDAIVATRIQAPNGAPVDVEYRLRSSEGVWRVIDVKVEGISLVSNYRDQFQAVLSQGGPDDLLGQLRERNAKKGGGEG